MVTNVLSSEHGELDEQSRRAFLRLLGLGTLATFVCGEVWAEPYTVWPTEDENDPTTWKRRLCTFTSAILPPAWSRFTNEQIAQAPYHYGVDNSFSSRFSSPVRLAIRIAPIATRYDDVTFELDALPYYDRMNPCRRSKDLNSVELARLLNPEELEYYGCVLSPCSLRQPLTAQDQRFYQRTVSDDYQINPRAYVPQYARNFTDGEHVHRAIGAVRSTEGSERLPLKNVFLTSFDVS